MKIMILHLSDLHIDFKNDHLEKKEDAIVNVVKNLEYKLDQAFIVVTGDISFSADDDQFSKGFEFFENLSKKLESSLSSSDDIEKVKVNLIVIPGNHDCNLPENDTVRKILVNGILNEENALNDDAVIEQCLKAQEEFFEYRNTYATDGLINNGKIYYEYKFTQGHENICFKCLNTAWMSQRKEQQAEIIYPTNKIEEKSGNETLVITLFHHPYAWLQADNSRTFRKKIEGLSDIILTGHEHDSSFRKQETSEGERNTYIEGGVFREHGSNRSDFNVVIIDTESKKQKYLHAAWADLRYEPAQGTVFSEDGSLAWHEYQVSNLRYQERFSPNETMMDFIEDPGAYFSRKNKALKLSDIYVTPDLRSVPTKPHGEEKHVRGDDVLNFIKENKYLLIVGDYQSGKTSLGKHLFLSTNKLGDVPLLIDSKKINIKGSFESITKKLFSQQYDASMIESFRQIDRSKRGIIIDDYHKLSIPVNKKKEFISWLCDFAGWVVLIADELEININEVLEGDGISSGKATFDYYVIQPFGFRRRDVVIKKWLTTNVDLNQNAIELARRIDSVSKTLDTLIGKNYVPAYPIYILSVLLAFDTTTPIDLSASTHGYFYELIIKIVIASGRTSNEYDIAASYLAFLAYKMFKGRHFEITDDQFKDIHREFLDKYVIDRSFEKMKSQLKEQHIIVEHSGIYSFKYKFMYYYFVASYLRDNLSRAEEVKQDISILSDALYIEEYANIMLFLAHLSKDPYIIEEMIKKAGMIFSDLKPTTLETDIEFLGGLEDVTKEIEIEAREKEQLRSELLEEKDRIGSERYLIKQYDEPVDDDVFDSNPALQLCASLKTLEIMGQMLKNFPGSMEASDKIKLTDSCYGLGLRTLTFALDIVRKNERELLSEFMNIIRNKNGELNFEKVSQKARESIVWVSQIISFCTIKRISYSVGTPELFPIYKKMLISYPFASVKLIDCSLEIDQAAHFPDRKIIQLAKDINKQWFPLQILKRIVALHLYLFEVPHDQRQRVCHQRPRL